MRGDAKLSPYKSTYKINKDFTPIQGVGNLTTTTRRTTQAKMVKIIYGVVLILILAATIEVTSSSDDVQEIVKPRGHGRNIKKRHKQGLDDPNGSISFVPIAKKRRLPLHHKITIEPKPATPAPQETTPADRQSRFLSLFTIVQFENQGCAASSGDNGTCMTASECTERGGIASGACANGYGVCCVFMATCGQTTRENCTYFVNNGYPASYDGTGSCQLTIQKAHPDICQFRLDFDQFTIAGPESTNNVCNNDQFIVSGGNPVPAICGVNNNNHMYIDAGIGATNPVTLTFVTSGPSFPRNWKVKVCQIPCNTIYRAEEGCLQYFTGVSGQIKSFNYDPGAGLQLSNQDYSICIRMERNFCGIQYTACPDTVNNRTQGFTLSGNTMAGPVTSMSGTVGPNSCSADWLIIPCATNVGRVPPAGASVCVDRLCGGTLNTEGSTTPATVYSTVKPFRLTFHTNNNESGDVGNRGFCLNYVQQPCTNNLS